MNKGLKAILIMALAVVTALLITSCKGVDNPYASNENDGYTVNVRYDANGGTYATNTTVIVDSYSPADFPGGMLPLLPPDSDLREKPFSAKKSGYFLAGWYTERTAVLDGDGNHLDEDGNVASESGNAPAYTYSGYWDFESDRLDLNGLEGNTVTLYAAWVPEFSFEFINKATGEQYGSISINPLDNSKIITLPAWNTATGRMDKNGFPELIGKTFDKAYTDAEGNNQITDATVTHTGSIDLSTATATDNVMKIYVDFLDGSWFRINTVEQLISNTNPTAHYIIESDLNFEEKAWPFANSVFSGSIIGNGHTLSNITAKQSSQSQQAGLFGALTESASITDITFENASYTIAKGSRNPGGSFGLFAGRINEGATLVNVSVSGSLTVSSDATNGSLTALNGDHSIGLVCGTGYEYCNIDYSSISVTALNEGTRYTVTVSADGNTVSWVRARA